MLFKNKIPLGKEIVYCGECQHKYFKDQYIFCKYRVGPLRSNGFCEKGIKKPMVHCKDCIHHASFFPICMVEKQLRFVDDEDSCFKGERK